MSADLVGDPGDGGRPDTPDSHSSVVPSTRSLNLTVRLSAVGASKPLRLVLGLIVAGGWLVFIDWHPLLPVMSEAYAKAMAGPCLPVSIVGQLVALALCSAGLKVLAPHIPIFGAFLSRWVRDAVGALPVGLPGLGEAAGIRVLSLFNSPVAQSVSVTTADVLAETLAQAIYALTAVALAPMSLRLVHAPLHLPGVQVLTIVSAAVVGTALAFRWTPAAWRNGMWSLLAQTGHRLRSLRFAISLAFHGAAWAAGGVQIFCLAQFLGDPLTAQQAFSLEGLVFAARAAAFFIPAGLGVQEMALVGVGGAYGLAPVDVAALALLFRLRDFAALVPAFPVWLALEARDALRPSSSTDASPSFRNTPLVG